MKVLVIEDEPLIRDIYAEFLDLLGHEADVAGDGREGLQRFDPLVHKVVVTDFLLPGLTGPQIAEAIRERNRTTPVVLISGSAEQPDEQRAAAGRAALLAQARLLRAVQGDAGGSRRACRGGAAGRMRGEWTAAAYAALYDRVVDGFAPYETLVDSVAGLIERLALADGRLAPCRSWT